MQNLKKLSIALILGCLLCSGCSNPKKSLGLSRSAPDEFTVVSRAPLTLPPDYTLTPPIPGGSNPKEGSSSDIARQGLFSTSETRTPPEADLFPVDESSDTLSNDKGARTLLAQAGALNADSSIRKQIQEDTSVLIEEDKEFIDKLVFWREVEDPTSVVVDAPKEKQRIQEVQALGQPITEGATPTIARKKKALLEF